MSNLEAFVMKATTETQEALASEYIFYIRRVQL